MSTAPPTLTPDDVDDLIYACRTDDLTWLSELLTTWSTQLNTSAGEIIRKAIDVDDEGLGSRACLLHYPAANGNLQLVEFLLAKLGETQTQPQTQTNGSNGTTAISLVNHQNVNGNTPLHWAALNGHLEVVKALVKAGADPTIVNEAGKDAVVEAEYSAKESAAECAAWLLKECDVLERGTGAPGDEEMGGEDGDGDVVVASSSAGTDGKVVNGDTKE